MSIPTGKWKSVGQDPNGAAFLKSVGYPDNLAQEVSQTTNEISIEKKGDNEYSLTISQPEIKKSNNLAFHLDQEQSSTLPSGKTVKSTFHWDEGAKQLSSNYNSEGQSWTVKLTFEGNGVTMNRDSQSAHSTLKFQQA